jgi:hypothetical protein
MKIGKRIVAVLTLLLSMAMLLVSVAGGTLVWTIKPPITAKATRIFERIDEALSIAEQNLELVKASLDRAASSLDSAREEQKQTKEPRALRRTLARKVQKQVAGELGDANEKLHTVADAAVVVNSILEDLGNFPILATSGLDMDRLKEMNGHLARVGPAAWELSQLLGEPKSDPDASSQMSGVERGLTKVRGWVSEFEPRLKDVREGTATLQSRTLFWITPAAAVISGVFFWIALSQLSLMCHAWSWLKH